MTEPKYHLRRWAENVSRWEYLHWSNAGLAEFPFAKDAVVFTKEEANRFRGYEIVEVSL